MEFLPRKYLFQKLESEKLKAEVFQLRFWITLKELFQNTNLTILELFKVFFKDRC